METNDQTPHVTVPWQGGSYSVLNALGDALTSFSFWRAVIVGAVLIAVLVWSWNRWGQALIDNSDREMDDRPHERLPRIRTIGTALIVTVLSIVVIASTASLVSNTYTEGTGREYRQLASDSLHGAGLSVAAADIPDRDAEERTAAVSRGTARTSADCKVVNLDTDATRAIHDYRLAVLCDGLPLNIGE